MKIYTPDAAKLSDKKKIIYLDRLIAFSRKMEEAEREWRQGDRNAFNEEFLQQLLQERAEVTSRVGR
jgi:hypothetical protein